jgi:hypothetical protein
LLAREAIHETEVVPEAEHHDTLHLLTLEAAEEVEKDRAAFHPRVSIMLQCPLVLQDEAIEETEEDMDQTGIATFLHLSKLNSQYIPDRSTRKARPFWFERRHRSSRVMDHFPFSCTPLFTLHL